MVTGIIGRKVGMTQMFDADGTVHPATVHQGRSVRGRAGEDRRRPTATRRCSSGSSRRRRPRSASRSPGHYKKAGVPPTRVRREVKLAGRRRCARRPAIRCSSSIFADGERVDVIGTSRGKGFQGVVKRHHFAGGARRTARCSIARPDRSAPRRSRRASSRACARPAAWAAAASTIRNLKVLRVDPDNHLLIVEGGIPGAPNGYVDRSARRSTAEEDQGGAGREAEEGQEVELKTE